MQTSLFVRRLPSVLVLTAGAMLQGPAVAASTSCMVVGESTARVKAVEGERSPVFVTRSCEALRLVSGRAQASWVGRDGKPRILPLTAEGLSAVPQPGSEERSVNMVWTELTTKRERQQPAYMRNIAVERPPRIFIPEAGLLVVDQTDDDAAVQVEHLKDTGSDVVASFIVSKGGAILIPRRNMVPDEVYSVKIQRGDKTESWRWRLVTAEQQRDIDDQLLIIRRDVEDDRQRSLISAMLFEQLKLRVNMDLTVQSLRLR